MIPAAPFHTSGSIGAGTASVSHSDLEPDQVEGRPSGKSEIGQRAAQTLKRVKPDQASASMLASAADVSRSLGAVLAYGLAVTVAISLLPESLLLALLMSFKNPAKVQDAAPQGEAADTDTGMETDTDMETDEGDTGTQATQGEPDHDEVGDAPEDCETEMSVEDYAISGEEGLTTPQPTFVVMPQEILTDTAEIPASREKAMPATEAGSQADETVQKRHLADDNQRALHGARPASQATPQSQDLNSGEV